MGSLLVWTTFGEMVAGRFILQRDKRSSENGFQTTFGLGRKGSSLERPRACVPHVPHTPYRLTCPNESAARPYQNESANIWRDDGIRAPPAHAGFRAARAGFANAVWAGGRLRRKRFGGGYAGRCRAGWFLLRGVRAWWRHEGKILGVGLLRGRQPENEIQAVIKFLL